MAIIKSNKIKKVEIRLGKDGQKISETVIMIGEKDAPKKPKDINSAINKMLER